jgi:hypothetical protein
MKTSNYLALVSAILIGTMIVGCSKDTDSLPPAPPNDDPVVFDDDFGSGVVYQPFEYSKGWQSGSPVYSVDPSEAYRGTASLRITIPTLDDPDGTFAGGAFTTDFARQLDGYNALTFWAKSSKNSTFNTVGLGNDNTGTSKYTASWDNVPLTTEWQKFTIPIPRPSRLDQEQGLFFIAEASEDGTIHSVWFDDIMFETVSTISNPQPVMFPADRAVIVGDVVEVSGTQTTFDVDGTPKTIQHFPGYFTYFSSADSVVATDDEIIRVVGDGTAVVTAQLDNVDVTGSVTLRSTTPPMTPPDPPTLPTGDVISLFSGPYTDVPVDRWTTDWDLTELQELSISGNVVKAYTDLVFAGIEFITETIDATSMTHFHLDLWVPKGDVFKIKLVDFGPDNEFGGGDDSEHEITLSPGSVPPLLHQQWISVDLLLSDFTNLTGRANLAQLIISGDPGTAYIDNVYFHK